MDLRRGIKRIWFPGRIEKLLASLGSARFAMRKSGRITTFSEGGDPLVAVPPLRYNGLQEGAA